MERWRRGLRREEEDHGSCLEENLSPDKPRGRWAAGGDSAGPEAGWRPGVPSAVSAKGSSRHSRGLASRSLRAQNQPQDSLVAIRGAGDTRGKKMPSPRGASSLEGETDRKGGRKPQEPRVENLPALRGVRGGLPTEPWGGGQPFPDEFMISHFSEEDP